LQEERSRVHSRCRLSSDQNESARRTFQHSGIPHIPATAWEIIAHRSKYTEYFSKIFGHMFSLLFIEDARGFDPLAAMQRDHGAALIRGSQQSHHDDKATHIPCFKTRVKGKHTSVSSPAMPDARSCRDVRSITEEWRTNPLPMPKATEAARAPMPSTVRPDFHQDSSEYLAWGQVKNTHSNNTNGNTTTNQRDRYMSVPVSIIASSKQRETQTWTAFAAHTRPLMLSSHT
jgi:hypothetical protein